MKNILLRMIALIVSMVLAATASAKQDIVTEARSSSMDFTKIEVGGSIRLIIENRTDGNLVIRGTEAAIRNLDLAVRKGVLHALQHGWNSGKTTIEIRIPNNGRITEIDCEGASSVQAMPVLSGRSIELEAEGASRIEARTSASSVEISCNGASEIKSDIQADRVEIDCEGASKAEVTGKAAYVEIDAEGASSVNAYGLESTDMKVEAEGASDVMVNCTGTLQALSEGTSKISYKGECRVSSSTGYLSKIEKVE